MKTESILDKDFNTDFQQFLFDQEPVLWEGSPNRNFSITLLELGGYYDVAMGPTSILGFVLAGIAYGVYTFYSQGKILESILVIILGIGLIILPDILKWIRKKNTKYAFTENRIFFKLWRWGDESVHILDFNDIGKITYEEYKDKSGIIYFLPKKPLDFHTHDFETGGRRFYPTFELVSNAIELRNTLENIRKENIKRNL